MQDPRRDHVIELIPAYALGSLDEGETLAVDRHLEVCPTCRVELVAYQSVVEMLPLAAPDAEPSPLLKGRLLAQVKTSPVRKSAPLKAPVPTQVTSPPRPTLLTAIRSRFTPLRWQPVALLFIVALVVSNILLWREVTQNGSDSSSWRRVSLTGSEAAPEARGIIYISADGRNGTLVVDGLPQLSQEQQYQLWLIQDGRRDSGAVFSVNEDGYRGLEIEADRPLRDFDAFGVTIEPAGGSPGPTGVRVLENNL